MKKYIVIFTFILFQLTIEMKLNTMTSELNNLSLEIYQNIARSLSLHDITQFSYVNKEMHDISDTLYASSNDLYNKSKLVTTNKNRFVQFIQEKESGYPQFTKQLKLLYTQLYFNNKKLNKIINLGLAISKSPNNFYQFYTVNNQKKTPPVLQFCPINNYNEFEYYQNNQSYFRNVFSIQRPQSKENLLDFFVAEELYDMKTLQYFFGKAFNENNIFLVKNLFKKGIDIEKYKSYHSIIPFEHNYIEIMKLLREYSPQAFSSLVSFILSKLEKLKRLKEIFDKCEFTDLLLNFNLKFANKLFHEAIKKEDSQKIEYILNKRPDFKMDIMNHHSVPQLLALSGNLSIISRLFEHDINFFWKHSYGVRDTIFASACILGSKEMLELIIKKQNINIKIKPYASDALSLLWDRYNLPMLEFLLDKIDINVDAPDCLLRACSIYFRKYQMSSLEKIDLEKIEYLLKKGADPNNMPLNCFSRFRLVNSLKELLLQYGLDKNVLNDSNDELKQLGYTKYLLKENKKLNYSAIIFMITKLIYVYFLYN